MYPDGKLAELRSRTRLNADFLSGRMATCLALAALVFACRAWLISVWGSPVPFWDQWGAEGTLYHAWLSGTLHWRDLVAAHNEHRIALTRLADLALLIVCGGWNPWAQLVLNAALHAATAGIVAAIFWPAVPPGPRVVFVGGLAVLFTSTAGWQNALWGFQSQVYFTNLFAVTAFVGLSTCTPLRPRWWLAPASLILALFSNAGGLLAVIVALGLAWPQEHTRRAWISWSAVATVLAIGALLRLTAPHHAALHARTFEQFLSVFARGLSWPHVNSPWAWLIMQLPLVCLCVSQRHCSRPVALTATDRLAMALAAFAILQAAAVGYTRAAGLPEFRPLSRYQDPLILGAAAQLYAAVRLATSHGLPARLMLVGWSALAFAGLISLTATNFSLHLPYKRAQDAESLEQIQTYLRTSNPNAFAGGTSFSGPDSNPAEVIRMLDDPVLRPVWPREFRDDTPRPWLLAYAQVLTCGAFFLFVSALAISAGKTGRSKLSVSVHADSN